MLNSRLQGDSFIYIKEKVMEVSVDILNDPAIRREDLFSVNIVNRLGGGKESNPLKRLKSDSIADYQILKWESLQSSAYEPRIYFMI